MLLDDGRKLLERGSRRLVLGDPGAHAHHVGERPVGDALAVRQTAAAVPVRDLGDAVEVLVELPRQPRLADAGDPGDRDQLRLPLVRADMEEILDLAELTVAADERRLEPCRLERAARPRDDTQRAMERNEADLPLQLVAARFRVRDRRLGDAPGRVTDEDGAGLGDRLNARGGVDEVAGDHAFAARTDRHGRLTREHPRPSPQLRHADLVAERGDGGHQVEGRPHRALGVVLGRRRRSPHRHHCIPDELLDGSAVQLDQPPARLEVARQQLPNLLRVARLRQRRETHQIREQHRHQTALRGRSRLSRRGRGCNRPRLGERRSTLSAELPPCLVRLAAGGADLSKRCPALAAELLVRSVLGATAHAGHHQVRSLIAHGRPA